MTYMRSGRVALGAQIGDDAAVLDLARAVGAVANFAVVAVPLGPHAPGVNTLRNEIGHRRIGTLLRQRHHFGRGPGIVGKTLQLEQPGRVLVEPNGLVIQRCLGDRDRARPNPA